MSSWLTESANTFEARTGSIDIHTDTNNTQILVGLHGCPCNLNFTEAV